MIKSLSFIHFFLLTFHPISLECKHPHHYHYWSNSHSENDGNNMSDGVFSTRIVCITLPHSHIVILVMTTILTTKAIVIKAIPYI